MMKRYYLHLAADAEHKAAEHYCNASLHIATFGLMLLVTLVSFLFELYLFTIFSGVFASILLFMGVYHLIEASVEEESARTYAILGGLYGRSI